MQDATEVGTALHWLQPKFHSMACAVGMRQRSSQRGFILDYRKGKVTDVIRKISSLVYLIILPPNYWSLLLGVGR